MTNDLRSYLAQLESGLVSIDKMVDSDLEIPCILQALEQKKYFPAVLFNRVLGASKRVSDFRVVSNLFADRQRLAQMLECDVQNSARAYMARAGQPIVPVFTDQAPVKDTCLGRDEFDLFDLPIVKHHEKDAGPYITSGIVVVRDPETGVINGAIQRLQLKGKDKLGLFMAPSGHNFAIFNKYRQRRQAMPVAIIIGHHPGFFLGMQCKCALDDNEYEIAGAFMGSALRLTQGWSQPDLDIPADAECVIEGSVPCEYLETEGPFGEYAHYYCEPRQSHIVQVSGLLQRDKPFYLDIFACHRDHHFLEGLAMEGQLMARLQERLDNVKHLYLPPSGCCQFYCYVSIGKRRAEDVVTVGREVLAAQEYIKHVIVVDEDINVFDEEEVLWALATRAKLSESIHYVRDLEGSLLDPSSHGGEGPERSIIDATWPFNRKPPERIGLPQALLRAVNFADLDVVVE